MGKDYRDEAWCDSIPMDFVHDGRRNTYTFKTRKLKLSCLQGQKSSKSSEEEGSNFLTLSNSNIR